MHQHRLTFGMTRSLLRVSEKKLLHLRDAALAPGKSGVIRVFPNGTKLTVTRVTDRCSHYHLEGDFEKVQNIVSGTAADEATAAA